MAEHEPSISSFPSLLEKGMTYLPGRVASHAPLIKRWNSGTDVGGPRTQHSPQHQSKPALDPTRLSEKLTLHSSCRGMMGPSHCMMQLTLLASDEAHHATGALEVQQNSVKLLHSLKRRQHAEQLLKRAQTEDQEWEKRYWLNEMLRRRAEGAAARQGVSARQHAATVAAAAAGAEGGASSSSRGWGSLAEGSVLSSSAQSFLAARRPLASSASSAHSLTPRTTLLPAEPLPRRPELTKGQRGALKVGSRAIHWEVVLENGEHPPQAPPSAPPTLSSSLPREGGRLHIANAGALAALGLLKE
jgi:hypothetical protein